MSSGIWASFLGALKASLSVLLTISYGVIASRFNLLKGNSVKDISKVCVRLFMPALLITNVGSQLRTDTVGRYVPVLIWALSYTLSSMALGWLLRRAFKFPAWTTPAICFNNTTALPLLLMQSLETSGILRDLTMGSDDTSSEAAKRAKSYFLFSSIIGNTLTFAIGPKLLDDEESPDEESTKEDGQDGRNRDGEHANPVNSSGRTAEEQEECETEITTLLPSQVADHSDRVIGHVRKHSEKHWIQLPSSIQSALTFVGGFLNAPLVGAIVGAVLGLFPFLHQAFFSDPFEGGFLNAWLTSSLKDIGDLFAALQLVCVGAKLSSALLKMKQGESGGNVKLIPVLSIFFIRFILWPVVSITIIYAVASRTNWLSDDPILWFVLMLMPTGPPATKLTAMADVNGASEDEKMAIAKFIATSYAISPVICFAVMGSLKASIALK